MSKQVLKPIYEKIYHRTFSPMNFEDRMKMQKVIYLMQEAGLSVGGYDFFWYKHGPYSQTLQEDILGLGSVAIVDVKYSDYALSFLSKLSKLLNMTVEYGESQWAECLASLKYLKTNIYSVDETDEKISDELQKRKPHLNNKSLNMHALKLLDKLYSNSDFEGDSFE